MPRDCPLVQVFTHVLSAAFPSDYLRPEKVKERGSPSQVSEKPYDRESQIVEPQGIVEESSGFRVDLEITCDIEGNEEYAYKYQPLNDDHEFLKGFVLNANYSLLIECGLL